MTATSPIHSPIHTISSLVFTHVNSLVLPPAWQTPVSLSLCILNGNFYLLWIWTLQNWNMLLMPFYIHILRKKKDEGWDIVRQLKECRRKGNSLLSLCPSARTLTFVWAASVCSCCLLACLSLSSRSARRVAQQDGNPSSSFSRACTACRSSSSSFLLLSIFNS